MKVVRGEIVLVQFPYPTGTGSKLRPAAVIQHDRGNTQMATTILAAVTTNISRVGQTPTQVLVDPQTPDGQMSGLIAALAVACENLATVATVRIVRKIGSLSAPLLKQVGQAINASLDVP